MNNDLISRSALKEEFLKYKAYAVDFLSLINNAPTVSDRYGEGYSQGYIDGSTGADWKGGVE